MTENFKIFKEGDEVIAKDKTDFYYPKNYTDYPSKVVKSYKDGTMDIELRDGDIKCVNQLLFKKLKAKEQEK